VHLFYRRVFIYEFDGRQKRYITATGGNFKHESQIELFFLQNNRYLNAGYLWSKRVAKAITVLTGFIFPSIPVE
jgi:hypothetical protein